ncbi:gastrula zinc finger protein xLCGF3.1-like [Cylas formicarius]|uniref:gastrula zinc finger protein xLCGF3.1-like n=1 Tax=Cylas formicarius TaxID=197179 RepID=UPI002958C869|nr:gastrula zinc finger protein xLCGF3.1-like [Cylas formicarius]
MCIKAAIRSQPTRPRSKWKCKKCLLHFDSPNDAKAHCSGDLPIEFQEDITYAYDETSEAYVCHMCSAEFQAEDEIRRHLARHEPKHVCRVCSVPFKTLRELCCHQTAHRQNGKLNCPICQYRTSYRSNLLTHLYAVHLSVYLCKVCGKSCSNERKLKEHGLVHSTERPFVCVVCSKTFPHHRSLISHQVRFHVVSYAAVGRQYDCDVCKTAYKTPGVLQLHVERAHRKQAKATNRASKKCLCDMCGQSFSTMVHLNKHLVSHTDYRPFVCSECGRAFKHNYALTYHQRIHTGERPFRCGYCDKNFRQNTPFRVHLRTHTGEKPYVCRLCRKGFTTNHGLKVHIKNCSVVIG